MTTEDSLRWLIETGHHADVLWEERIAPDYPSLKLIDWEVGGKTNLLMIEDTDNGVAYQVEWELGDEDLKDLTVDANDDSFFDESAALFLSTIHDILTNY